MSPCGIVYHLAGIVRIQYDIYAASCKETDNEHPIDIEKYGLKHHPNFFLLFPGFKSITLFGHVFYRMDKDALEKYLETRSGKVTSNHFS